MSSSGSSRIPQDASFYRNLLDVYRASSRSDPEGAAKELARLPDPVVQVVARHMPDLQRKPSESSFDKTHLFSSLPDLQKACHRVAYEAFSQLEAPKKQQVLERLRMSSQSFSEWEKGDSRKNADLLLQSLIDCVDEPVLTDRTEEEQKGEPFSPEAIRAAREFIRCVIASGVRRYFRGVSLELLSAHTHNFTLEISQQTLASIFIDQMIRYFTDFLIYRPECLDDLVQQMDGAKDTLFGDKEIKEVLSRVINTEPSKRRGLKYSPEFDKIVRTACSRANPVEKCLIEYIFKRSFCSLLENPNGDFSTLIKLIDFISDFSKIFKTASDLHKKFFLDLSEDAVHFSRCAKAFLDIGDLDLMKKTPLDFGIIARDGEPSMAAVDDYLSAMSYSITPMDHYQAALCYYNSLCVFLQDTTSFFEVGHFVISDSMIKSGNVRGFIDLQERCIGKTIEKMCGDDVNDKGVLKFIVARSLNRLREVNNSLIDQLRVILSYDFYGSYGSVISTNRPELPELLISEKLGLKSLSTDKKRAAQEKKGSLDQRKKDIERKNLEDPYYGYALSHHKVYEDFIPRLREISAFMSSVSEQNEMDLLVLRHFIFFLEAGNGPALIDRLKEADGNVQAQEAIFFEAIREFSCQQEENSGVDRVELTSMQKMVERSCKGLENSWVLIPRTMSTLLDAVIVDSPRWEPYLFLGASGLRQLMSAGGGKGKPSLPAQSVERPRSADEIACDIENTTVSKSKKNGKGKRSQSSKSDRSKGSPPSSASQLPTVKSQANLVQTSSSSSRSAPIGHLSSSSGSKSSFPAASRLGSQIAINRRHLDTWQRNFQIDKKSVTGEAIWNAYEHFDNLLCSVRRLNNLCSEGRVAPASLFSFVNDCIRHSTLGVEQTLSALYRETRQIQSREELAPHLTHHLIYILQNCKMQRGDLSPDVRRWIREINGGEMMIRDYKLQNQDSTVLQNLLRANLQFMEESSPENVEILVTALSAYLKPLGKFLSSIQERLLSEQGSLVPSEVNGFEQELSILFSSLCDQIRVQTLLPLSSEDDPVANLAVLRSMLDDAAAKTPFASHFFGHLDNVLDNLLVRLETELLSNRTLEPIEASLHLTNVLLLNQLIAESVFLHKINAQGIPVSYEESCQHDLFALAEKLGAADRFTEEELSFLKTGRASRQLVRYPASYLKQGSPKKSEASRFDKIASLMRSSRMLANSQAPEQDLQGFIPANRSQARELEEVRNFVDNDLRLMCSIVTKLLGS